MAQYRKGKKSPWYVQFREKDLVTGKSVLRTHTFTRREDALCFEAKLQREKELTKAGMEKPVEEILLVDFAAKFIEQRYADPDLAKGTVDADNRRLRLYWIQKFGGRPMGTISSAEIQSHLNYIQFDLGHEPSDRNRHRALMHTLFQKAFMENKVLFNPVAKVPLVKENVYKNKSNRLETEEEREAYVRAMYKEAERYGIIAEIMLWTGCRVCTAIGLQWRDIDFAEGYVSLARQLDRTTKEIVERQKGGEEGEEIDVPLVQQLRAILSAHKLKSPYCKPKDHIATRPDGRYVPYKSFYDAHVRVVKRLELDQHVTPHGLRRTFATSAKKAGYTRTEIKELLNHSTEQMLIRYDIKEASHLREKAERIGFGKLVEVKTEKKEETGSGGLSS